MDTSSPKEDAAKKTSDSADKDPSQSASKPENSGEQNDGENPVEVPATEEIDDKNNNEKDEEEGGR